jgi:hypothetical protein
MWAGDVTRGVMSHRSIASMSSHIVEEVFYTGFMICSQQYRMREGYILCLPTALIQNHLDPHILPPLLLPHDVRRWRGRDCSWHGGDQSSIVPRCGAVRLTEPDATWGSVPMLARPLRSDHRSVLDLVGVAGMRSGVARPTVVCW